MEKARGVEANVEGNLTSAAASWTAAGTSLCAEQSWIGVHNMSAIVADHTVFPSDPDSVRILLPQHSVENLSVLPMPKCCLDVSVEVAV